ncbi:MAG: DUF928 domain-containing protein [Cyanobacteria bacterium SBLK]|nr:DUF928 domain-containing protein [Cyanobacteria bacterium SBLK]
MTPINCLSFPRKSIAAFFLAGLLLCSPSAFAEYSPQTKNRTRENEVSGGGTRRACLASEETEKEIDLLPLASRSYQSKTASSHPQFSVFVSSSVPARIEFKLYEYPETSHSQLRQIGATKTIERTTAFEEIVTIAPISENEPGLVANKTYLWQVTLFWQCAPDRPDQFLWERREFTTIEPPATLSSDLSAATDRYDRVNAYARAELWYEALAETKPSQRLDILGGTLLEQLVRWEESSPSPEDGEGTREWSEGIRNLARRARRIR